VTSFSIVIPTVARPSLAVLLEALRDSIGPRPDRVVVVDDRKHPTEPAVNGVGGWLDGVLELRYSGGRGPAAARNIGWRACDSEWIAFLDDDVLVPTMWLTKLATDLVTLGEDVGGCAGRIDVPLPDGRRPTDWERGTAGLASAKWITADIVYRRAALLTTGGFDERFPRAFREDADLALRVQDAGWRLVQGRRHTTHPVRPARWRASLDQQRGNADDVLMTRLHGPGWYARAEVPRGRRPWHLATTAAAVTAAGAVAAQHPVRAAAAATAWAALTADFAWRRIAPGPRDPAEVTRMIATSVLIPPAATWYWLRGQWRHRGARPWAPPVQAVLFDRDGTLVHDMPYNGDPAEVRPVAGAREAVQRLRAAGVKVGVVSNQSGVARGLLDLDDVARVNARIDELLGPFDTWQVCPHAEDARCACRKPAPGLVLTAARELGVRPERLAVIGDIGSDVAAGEAAGAQSWLVPNGATRPEEIVAARRTAPDLATVVEALLARRAGDRRLLAADGYGVAARPNGDRA
jgi:histidinol-phosphate phosphatase family protein